MKKLIMIVFVFIFAMLSAVPSQASVYAVSYGDYEVAYSTNGACQYDYLNRCHWIQPVQIGVKTFEGNDSGRWIVLPQWYGLPQEIKVDIAWAENYVITNNIPARYGACYPEVHLWNMLTCFY